MSYNGNKSCVTLNSMQTTSKWTDNSTSLPLDFMTLVYPPLLTFNDWYTTDGNTSLYNYQFCGPLIVLLKFFAQHINTEIKFPPLIKEMESYVMTLGQDMMMGEKLFQVLVFPMFPLSYMESIYDMEYGLSRYIWGADDDVVLSKTHKIERPVFGYLDCWDRWLYIGVLLSLVIISLISALREGSSSAFFTSWWKNFTIMNSTPKTPIHSSDKLLTGAWLLVMSVLFTIFSGQLYEMLINGQVIDRIENRVELFTKRNWRDSKIYVADLGIFDFIVTGITTGKDPIAQQFFKRSSPELPFEVIFNIKMQNKMINDVLINNAVIFGNKLSLYYLLRQFQTREKLILDQMTEGVDYYVSKPQRIGIPYHFMIVKDVFPEHLLIELNTIISRVQESGIYEFETRMSVTPQGFGPPVDLEYKIPEELRIKPIVLKDLRGVFVLLLFGWALSIMFILIDIVYMQVKL